MSSAATRTPPTGGGRSTSPRALERLAEVEALAPHLDWIAETAPRAIVDGEPLAAPF